ncbi:MAG: DUF1489 domain-containing protein [Proteobacteria bacterium]|nr:DUF1489 domain-containing protein [Pseudomonadota bacterium]MDA1059041.1 DUF1489 domain-containing protein [Pseudomonadota bacterium]
MPLNILKLCVGIDDVDQLRIIQVRRLKEEGILRHFTRHRPRRAAEITSGGSIYWIIKGYAQVRQRIVAIETATIREGKPCAFVLDPELVLTVAQPRRPHQGWRYLEDRDAPGDAGTGPAADADHLPAPLARTLKEIGAW